MVTQGHTEQAMRRLLDEYLAMPGLSLTVAQMRRLLALDAGACQELLAVLAQTGWLVRRTDGRFVRPPEIELAAWRRAVQVVVGETGGLGDVVAAPMSYFSMEIALDPAMPSYGGCSTVSPIGSPT